MTDLSLSPARLRWPTLQANARVPAECLIPAVSLSSAFEKGLEPRVEEHLEEASQPGLFASDIEVVTVDADTKPRVDTDLGRIARPRRRQTSECSSIRSARVLGALAAL